MEEKEFLREKEKLKNVVKQLSKEEQELEQNIGKSNGNYDDQAYVKAHLEYLNQKKLSDLKKIKTKPYFARIDFTPSNETKEEL